jgi:hypothetical protein
VRPDRLQIIWPSVGVALSESRALLLQASAGQVDHPLAHQIASRLGDHPRALSLVAGRLRSQAPWTTILASLARQDLTFGGRKERSVFATMASGVEALPSDERSLRGARHLP